MDNQAPYESSTQNTGSSEGRLRANRSNAQHSTGPTTAEGKARSSMNALKSGVYANTARPIAIGQLGEDHDGVAGLVSATVTELDPRNTLELVWATKVAGLIVAEHRRDRYEAYRLEAASRLSPADHRAIGGDPADLLFRNHMLTYLWQWGHYLKIAAQDPTKATAEPFTDPADQACFQHLCKMLRTDLKTPITVKDLWDDKHEPADDQAWKRCFKTIIAKQFATPDEILTWVQHRTDIYETWLDKVEQHAAEIVAERALAELDRALGTGARIGRELRTAYDFYRSIRTQPVNSPPNDVVRTDAETKIISTKRTQ